MTNRSPARRRLLASLSWLIVGACIAGEPRLEGVNILGAARSAYISVDGSSSRLKVGDSLAGWTVHAIESRSVELRGPDGGKRTLWLQHGEAVAEPAPATTEKGEGMVADDAEKPAVIAPPPPEKTGEGSYHITPRFLEDEEIPEGFKRVRTPFGDFLVEEKK